MAHGKHRKQKDRRHKEGDQGQQRQYATLGQGVPGADRDRESRDRDESDQGVPRPRMSDFEPEYGHTYNAQGHGQAPFSRETYGRGGQAGGSAGPAQQTGYGAGSSGYGNVYGQGFGVGPTRGNESYSQGLAGPPRERDYRGMSGTTFGTPGLLNHTGRGPRNYQRSNERITDDVCERLTQHPEVDASDIEVKVDNGEVTLTGMVNSRHEKRLAEDLAEDVFGVRDVHNQIRVRRPGEERNREGHR